MKNRYFCLSCHTESPDESKNWSDFCPYCGADNFLEKVDIYPSNNPFEHIYMLHGIDALKKILDELLYCTELNLDEMESHTCEVVQKAHNLLNFIEQVEKES